MRMTVNIDELGPVDWIVVEFPGSKFNGEVAPVLRDYVDRGLIRILDLLILKKDADGAFEAFETSDLDDSEIGELRGYETELAMLLSEQDVIDLAETIEPGSSAAVLVWENLWAAPFGTAVRHAGGQLTASGRIPIQAVIAAIEADGGRSLTCPWQRGVCVGPQLWSAARPWSPTASTVAVTGVRTAVTTVATGATTAATAARNGPRGGDPHRGPPPQPALWPLPVPTAAEVRQADPQAHGLVRARPRAARKRTEHRFSRSTHVPLNDTSTALTTARAVRLRCPGPLGPHPIRTARRLGL